MAVLDSVLSSLTCGDSTHTILVCSTLLHDPQKLICNLVLPSPALSAISIKTNIGLTSHHCVYFQIKYHVMEKTDNAPRKNTFPSPHSWPSAGVRCFFSSSFHTRPLWECVWKEEEKSTPTPALCQEWEEGNVFFLGALSVFSTWGYFQCQRFFLIFSCYPVVRFF